MTPIDYAEAVLLGAVEGLTELIPVSSTGHLILLGDLLGFQGPPEWCPEDSDPAWRDSRRADFLRAHSARGGSQAPSDPGARRFIAAILIAFLPAAVIGALAHGSIKSVLFSPWVVSVSLILGGFAILLIERWRPEPSFNRIDRFSPWLALQLA